MDTNSRALIMQRWNAIQFDLIPQLADEMVLTPKLEKVIHILDFVRVEEHVSSTWCGIGRPPAVRAWLANAFVAKSVLDITNTRNVIDRLRIDRSLRRICGFSLCRPLPSESTFSRAFEEFAKSALAERTHAALVKEHLGDTLIEHLSRDGTAIHARERPANGKSDVAKPEQSAQSTLDLGDKDAVVTVPPATMAAVPVHKPKRGRPRKDEVRLPAKESPIARQRKQILPQMLSEIPTACDRGAKCNAQGYKIAWNGYKLHIDTSDYGVPISALLSSASMHDSRAAIPLSLISQQRVTNLYDLMDAAYCSVEIHEHCRSLGHAPIIDHNPRGGAKEEFEPADAIRYRERTVAERINARLKDEFGGRHVMVKGAEKVMSHLMFGILALSADQLMRLRR
jgi:hypothetical protein